MKKLICCFGILRHYSDKLANEFDAFNRRKRVYIQTRARRNTSMYDPIEEYLPFNFYERDVWHQQFAQERAFKKHAYKNRLERQKNENFSFRMDKPELKPEFKPKFLWGLNQHVPFERFKNLELGAFVSEQVKQESFDRLETLVWEQMSQELDFCVHINFYDMVNLLENTIETTHWVAGVSEPWTLDQELYFHDLIEETTCPNTIGHLIAYYRIKTLFQFAARAAVKSKVSWREAYFVLMRVLCSAQCQLLPIFYPYALSRACVTTYGHRNKKPTVSIRPSFSPMLKPEFQLEFGLDWVTASKIVKQRAVKTKQWSRFKPLYVSHEEALYIVVTSARSTLQMESHNRRLERLDRQWSKKSKT